MKNFNERLTDEEQQELLNSYWEEQRSIDDDHYAVEMELQDDDQLPV